MLPARGISNLAQENFQLNQRERLAGQTRLRSLPYLIQMGADHRCNMRCGFCMVEADREVGNLNIQDRKLDHNALLLFEKMVPYMPCWKFLSLTGPGESLLNPKIGHILELIRRHSHCTILITTNGSLIHPGLARTLVEQGVDEISISLDSLDKTVYEGLRVGGRFEKVMGAIDLLNAAKRRRASKLPRINLTPVFVRRNIGELPDFIAFAREKGIHSVLATPAQILRPSWVDESLLHCKELTARMARQAERWAEELGVTFTNHLKPVYTRVNGSSPEIPTDPAECLKPWASVYIEQDGNVSPCCYRSPVYGNILRQSFAEIWNGETARTLRRSMIQRTLPEGCRHCPEFNRHRREGLIQIRPYLPSTHQPEPRAY